jgi:hypothetical protein
MWLGITLPIHAQHLRVSLWSDEKPVVDDNIDLVAKVTVQEQRSRFGTYRIEWTGRFLCKVNRDGKAERGCCQTHKNG